MGVPPYPVGVPPYPVGVPPYPVGYMQTWHPPSVGYKSLRDSNGFLDEFVRLSRTKAALVVWVVRQCKHEFAEVSVYICWGLFVKMRTDYEMRLHFVFDMLQNRGLVLSGINILRLLKFAMYYEYIWHSGILTACNHGKHRCLVLMFSVEKLVVSEDKWCRNNRPVCIVLRKNILTVP